MSETPKVVDLRPRAMPPSDDLREPVRNFAETFSAWTLVKRHFFPTKKDTVDERDG